MREDEGALAPSGRRLERPSPRATAVLNRALCRFAFFNPPDHLTSAQADRAARLFAETNAPYRSADFLVVRGIAGYGVWWWDGELVRKLVPGWPYEPGRVVPETLLYAPPAGDGWRLLQLEEGFEAQRWQDFTLTASVWRRREFAEDQWAAFVNASPGPLDAPAALPRPTQERADVSAIASIPRVKAPPGWKTTERAGVTCIGLSAIAACAFLAGAGRYELAVGRYERLTRELASQSQSAPLDYRQDLAVLQQLAVRVREPNPMLAATRALRAVQPLGATPQGWSVEEHRLRLEVASSLDVQADAVAAALEADDWLSNVSAQIDSSSARTIFVADICRSLDRNACAAQSQEATR